MNRWRFSRWAHLPRRYVLTDFVEGKRIASQVQCDGRTRSSLQLSFQFASQVVVEPLIRARCIPSRDIQAVKRVVCKNGFERLTDLIQP